MKVIVKTKTIKPTRDKDKLLNLIKEMIEKFDIEKPVRRIGVSLKEFLRVSQKFISDF